MRVEALSAEIAALAPDVALDEAERVAYAALAGSAELAREYRLTRPALLHNLLVNTALRERGLCCHFTEDLLARLRALELETLELSWVVARHGSQLREHSSVLLRPRGGAFEHGLVIDAWRESGELVWAPAGGDRYPWVIHPLDGDWAALHCR